LKRTSTTHPNVFLYPHGTYYFRGHFNGEAIEKTLKTKDFGKAKKLADALVDKLSTDDLISTTVTVGSMWLKYLSVKDEARLDGKLSLESYKNYEWTWDKYLCFFDKVKLRDMADRRKGPEHWRKFKSKYRHLNMFSMRKLFMSFLSWCHREGHISRVMPCDIPEYESRVGKFLTESQRDRLLKAAQSHPDMFLFCLMYLTMAMRKSEITQASWDQVNFTEGWILTKKKKSRTKPARQVPLHPLVRSLLLERSKNKSPFIFPHRDVRSRPMSRGGLSKAWTQTIQRAGLNGYGFQMHDMRRTWETEAQRRGDLTDIQREKFAGHSSKIAKERYTIFSADHLRPLVDVVKVDTLSLETGHDNDGNNVGNKG